jgi:hypothetical protein
MDSWVWKNVKLGIDPYIGFIAACDKCVEWSRTKFYNIQNPNDLT